MADPWCLGVSMAQRPKLGELLVAAGVIDAAALEGALAKQSTQGGRLGKLLVEAGALSEETLVRTLARQMSIPVAWLRDKQVKPEVLAHLPGHVALKHRCLPVLIDRRGGDTLLIAMEDPSDATALDEIASAAGCPVRVVLAAPSELDDALARHYPDDEEAPGDEEPELLLDDPLAIKSDSDLPAIKSGAEEPASRPAVAAEAETPGFDLAAPGDSGLDLGSDLDLVAPPGGGVDLEAGDALDLEADTDAGGRAADSLDAAIDDVRAAAPAGDADSLADTGTDLDIGPDLETEDGPDSDLDIGPDLELDDDSPGSGPRIAASGSSGQEAAREALPRDPELRAVVLLLVERGLLTRDEIALCLHAAQDPTVSES